MRPHDNEEPRSTTMLSAMAISAIFFLLGNLSVYNHEMWRDELQAWMLAKDNMTLLDLFHALKYEGHPGLWHVALMPLTRLFSSPGVMQALHLCVATLTVYVFTRYSPFPKFIKWLVPFGYFFYYEYSVIARNYAFAVLLVFVVCAYYCRRFVHPERYALILALLANTNVFGTILTITFSAALALEYHLLKKGKLIKAWRVYAGLAISLFGVLIATLQMVPATDATFAVGWAARLTMREIGSTGGIVGRVFVPLPRFQINFWRSVYRPSPNYLWGLISLTVLGWIVFVFRKHIVPLLIYFAGIAGILLFCHTKYCAGPRHWGFLFILFLACLWISRYYERDDTTEFGKRMAKPLVLLPLLVILFVHVGAAGIAGFQDFRHPFSTAQATVAFLRDNDMADAAIVAYPDYTVSAVAGYLGRQVYYVQGQGWGTYVIWKNSQRFKNCRECTVDMVVEAARDASSQVNRRPVLVVAGNDEFRAAIRNVSGLKRIAAFSDAIVREETFEVYEINQFRVDN